MSQITINFERSQETINFLIPIAVMLVIGAGCTAGTEINTPVPTKAGTPALSGEISVPGVSIQVNAPGPNPLVNKADTNKHVAGVWMGVWHRIISPITLLISFNNPNVQMYEVHNDDSQYNLGFLVEAALLFAILGVFVGSRRR